MRLTPISHRRRNEVRMAEFAKKVSRRHVVQGAAWTVPVVAVASAAPAHAASSIPVTLYPSCGSLGGSGVQPAGFPIFGITAGDIAIPSNSTFLLTNDQNIGSNLKIVAANPKICTLTVTDAGSAVVTLTSSIAPRASAQIEIGGDGSIYGGITLANGDSATFTLSVDVIVGGTGVSSSGPASITMTGSSDDLAQCPSAPGPPPGAP